MHDNNSGSGSVGLESLSRGAHHATFVDMSRDCCGACEENVARCGFDTWNEGGLGADEGEPTARVVCSDAFRALREPESVGIPPVPYDVLTLCPPYEEIVYSELLEAAANSVLVKEDTVLLVEYPVELVCLPHVIKREDGGVLVGVRNRKYGRTVSVGIILPQRVMAHCLTSTLLWLSGASLLGHCHVHCKSDRRTRGVH